MYSIERQLRVHYHFSSHRMRVIKRPQSCAKPETLVSALGALGFVILGSHNVA